MGKLKRKKNVGKIMEQHCRWKHLLGQPLQKTVQWYLLQLNISIFYVPALVFYPTEICRMFSKEITKNVHSSIICNSPNLGTTQMPINGRIYKLWYIHTTEYQSTEHEQFTSHLKLSVNFTNIKLNEISRTQKRTQLIFLFIVIANTGKSNLYVW